MKASIDETVRHLTETIDFDVLHKQLLSLKSETLKERAKQYFDGSIERQLYGVNQFYHLETMPHCDAALSQHGTLFFIFPIQNRGKDFSLEALISFLKKKSFEKFGVFRNIYQVPVRTPLDEPRPRVTCLGLMAHRADGIEENGTLLYVAGFGFKKELGNVSADEWDCRLIHGKSEEIRTVFEHDYIICRR